MAITFDASSSPAVTSGVSSLTFAHTCSNSDRCLVVGSIGRDTTAADTVVTGITYNGVALTEIAQQLEAAIGTMRAALFYLIAPATGANNIVVTWAASLSQVAGAVGMSFNGVDQTTAVEAFNSGVANNTTGFSVSVNTITDNAWVVSVLVTGAGAGTGVGVGSGDTLRAGPTSGGTTDDTVGGSTIDGVSPAGSASVDWVWTTGGNSQAAMIVAALVPAAGGGAPSKRRYSLPLTGTG